MHSLTVLIELLRSAIILELARNLHKLLVPKNNNTLIAYGSNYNIDTKS